MKINKEYAPIRGHYYIHRDILPFAGGHKRHSVELTELPEIGDIKIIGPDLMETNESKVGPGIFRVVAIRPNYDYTMYPSFWEIDECFQIMIEPVKTMAVGDWSKFSFSEFFDTEDPIDIKTIIQIVNLESGTIEEIEC